MRKSIAAWILAICTLTMASNAQAQMGFPWMYQQHADQQALGPLPDAEYDQYVSDILNAANDCVQKALRLNEIAANAAQNSIHRAETITLIKNLVNNMNNCSMAQFKGREFSQILELRGVPSKPPTPPAQ